MEEDEKEEIRQKKNKIKSKCEKGRKEKEWNGKRTSSRNYNRNKIYHFLQQPTKKNQRREEANTRTLKVRLRLLLLDISRCIEAIRIQVALK